VQEQRRVLVQPQVQVKVQVQQVQKLGQEQVQGLQRVTWVVLAQPSWIWSQLLQSLTASAQGLEPGREPQQEQLMQNLPKAGDYPYPSSPFW